MTLHQIKTAEINSAVITGAGKKKGEGRDVQCSKRQKFGNMSKIKPPQISNQ